jgi:hypothetical protein
MRTPALSPLGFLAILAVVGGCVAEQETVTQPSLKKGGTTTPVGEENTNGEHGTNAPAGPAAAPDPGTSVGTEKWENGKKIDANVTISKDAIVEIAPGAVITVAANAAITIKGTLKIASVAAHAKLVGTKWTGLVVAQGGTLASDGLEIEGAESALWTQTGNLAAKFANGAITATTPFKMEAGSKLEIVKTSVKAGGGSAIAGVFTASRMTYDKGTNGGLTLGDPAGTMTISDSILKGAGGGDYVISSAGKLLKLEYTIVSGSHCGLHFSGIDQYILDHVSAEQNSWGAMLYGSGAGPNQIIASNIRNTDKNLDMQNVNGPLTIDKSFIGVATKNTLQDTATITNAAGAALTDAKPRPE